MGFFKKLFSNPIAAIGDTVDYVVDVVGDIISWAVDIPEMPDLGDLARGSMVNKESNIDPIPVIYGTRRVGGTRVFVESSGSNNTYLYMAIILGEGEVDSIGEIFIDDTPLTGSAYASKVSVDKKVGTDDQSASTVLLDAPSWSDTDTLSGIAYLGLRLTFDQDVFSRIPQITAIVNGRKVFDPRTSTTAFSKNPALCLRDYLTNARYGKGLDINLIDDTSFSSSATACEVEYETYSGSGVNIDRFECNALVDTDKSLFDNVKMLLNSMQGMMPFQDGKYRLIVDDDYTSTFSFTTDNIIGGIDITGVSKKSRYNKVLAKFINPDANYQADSVIWPEADSADEATFLSEDNNIVLEKQTDFPFVTNYYQARNLAKTLCLESRKAGMKIQFVADSSAIKCAVGDIVTVTHPTPAWTDKKYRITRMSIGFDATVQIVAAEHDASIYPWVNDKEQPAAVQTNLPDPLTITPVGLDVTDELRSFNQEAISVLVANITFTDEFIERIEVQAQKGGDTVYINMGQASGGQFELPNVEDGATYTVRARAFNSLGVRSAYTTVAHQVVGKTAPPADVTDLSANVINGQIQLSWTPVTDLDLSHYLVRYQNVTAGASYQNANTIAEKVARPANTLTTEARAGTYFVRAIDKLGIPSASPANIVVTTDMITMSNLNVVETQTENPSFAGVVSNVAVVDNSLKLSTTELFDSATGNFDDREGVFDSGDGTVTTSGTYDFANIIDLSQKFTSRVTANLTSTRLDYVGFFDDATGDFDDREGLFDGDQAAFDTTDVQLFVRTSNTGNDPYSSPSDWTDFRRFVVGDYTARSFQFRAKLTSSDANATPLVSALSATVDMPDRIDNKTGESTGADGANAGTFNFPFQAVPTIGIAIKNQQQGDYYTLSSISTDGYTINIYDSGGSPADRSYDIMAKGYGRRIA